MSFPIEGARRLMETFDPDVVNQYLRFGWKLINQYRLEATTDAPARVKYVLASIRTLEETKELVALQEIAAVNQYLRLGWRLIDKFVTADASERRHETIHFIVAWMGEGDPIKPGTKAAAATGQLAELLATEIELDFQTP